MLRLGERRGESKELLSLYALLLRKETEKQQEMFISSLGIFQGPPT